MTDTREDMILPPTGLVIDGSFTSAASGERFETFDPATGQVLASIARGADPGIDRAVTAARAAFESGVWSRYAPVSSV